jgi:hypothetical protein
MFRKLKFDESFDYEHIYPSNHDAVLHIFYRKTMLHRKMSNAMSHLGEPDNVLLEVEELDES